MAPAMSARDLLRLRRAERDVLLTRVTALLLADTRIVAAWLIGSLGRGDGDDLSDIDLRIVVADEHIAAVLAERRECVKRLGVPTLIQDAPRNAPADGAFLLVFYASDAGPQCIDWTWQPQSHARIPLDAHVLFDHVGIARQSPPPLASVDQRIIAVTDQTIFFWMMCNVAAKIIVRRQRRYALQMIDAVAQALHRVCWLIGLSDSEPGYKDTRTDAPPVEPIAQLAALRALAQEMEALTPQIIAFGATAPREAIPQVYRFFALVEAMLAEDVGAS